MPEELEEEHAGEGAPGEVCPAGAPRATGPEVAPASAAATGAGLFDPTAYSPAEKRALLSALLFASGEVVEAARLADYLGLPAAELALLAEEAAGELRPRGLDILAAAGGLRLVTAAQWDEPLAQFHRQVRRAKLSRGALEILAVIAYEQPVARTRIDDLRQVNSESTIRTLLDRRLITVAGRAETPGRRSSTVLRNVSSRSSGSTRSTTCPRAPPRSTCLRARERGGSSASTRCRTSAPTSSRRHQPPLGGRGRRDAGRELLRLRLVCET